jgi:DNA-binding PucR family transcriptional regulator
VEGEAAEEANPEARAIGQRDKPPRFGERVVEGAAVHRLSIGSVAFTAADRPSTIVCVMPSDDDQQSGDRPPGKASRPGLPGQLATVRELLAVKSLRLRLVAGEAGLDRPVRWAHAIELEDPRPYLRGHELVLTMGSVLRDGPTCRAFVMAVLERDASGIGFGCGNYQPESPPELRAACDAAGLPLLEVPVDVLFIAITEELAERMAVRRAERDRRSLRREAHLLDLLAQGRGLEGIARSVARELDATIVIAGPEGTPEAVAVAGAPVEGAVGIVRRAIDRVRAGDRRPAIDAGPAVCELVAVRHRRATIGWLGRVRWPGGRADGLEVLHEVAPIVSIELATRAQERSRDRAAVGRLLRLVRSGVADPVVLSERILEARLDEERLFVSVWAAEAAEPVRHALPRLVIGEADDQLLVIGDDADPLTAVATELGLACGIGSTGGLADIGRSLVEAEAAFGEARTRGGIATWRDLATLATLLGQQPADRLDAFANQIIVPLAEYDATRGSELLATVRMFLELEGGVEATARRMHIHPNSLRHRLRRVHVISGRDPFSFQDRVALYIGLWSWDVQHRPIAQHQGLNVVVPDD